MIISDTVIGDLTASISSILNGSLPLILILFGIGISFFVLQNILKLLPK